MTILIFSYRMTAFNQSFWSSQLNSQLTSRRFHLGVPQTPLVSTPPHWTLVCFPPSSHLPTASPSNQDLSSSFTPSLILSHIKQTMKSTQLYLLYILWSLLFPSAPSREEASSLLILNIAFPWLRAFNSSSELLEIVVGSQPVSWSLLVSLALTPCSLLRLTRHTRWSPKR